MQPASQVGDECAERQRRFSPLTVKNINAADVHRCSIGFQIQKRGVQLGQLPHESLPVMTTWQAILRCRMRYVERKMGLFQARLTSRRRVEWIDPATKLAGLTECIPEPHQCFTLIILVTGKVQDNGLA